MTFSLIDLSTDQQRIMIELDDGFEIMEGSRRSLCDVPEADLPALTQLIVNGLVTVVVAGGEGAQLCLTERGRTLNTSGRID